MRTALEPHWKDELPSQAPISLRALLRAVIFFSGTCLASCAGHQPVSVKASLSTRDLKLEEIGTTPFVYRITEFQPVPPEDLFLTAVRDCDRPHKLSDSALARQLLVGFKNVNLKEVKETSYHGAPITISSLTAELHDTPLEATHLLMRDSSCIVDIVMWSKTLPPLSEEVTLKLASPFL